MSLMGCHSKMLWNEVYNQIVDILLAKAEKSGIIVCKYFHEIHSELLDIFYSYMQSNSMFNNICKSISDKASSAVDRFTSVKDKASAKLNANLHKNDGDNFRNIVMASQPERSESFYNIQ